MTSTNETSAPILQAASTVQIDEGQKTATFMVTLEVLNPTNALHDYVEEIRADLDASIHVFETSLPYFKTGNKLTFAGLTKTRQDWNDIVEVDARMTANNWTQKIEYVTCASYRDEEAVDLLSEAIHVEDPANFSRSFSKTYMIEKFPFAENVDPSQAETARLRLAYLQTRSEWLHPAR
ncbi:hypothetical protein TREMEDRAFT_58761 [Tremella mesenterica DSM 1558]|uniref:uncharacterized protein n=1 Tax=Tremella mesenterica (strain ATCC 24925 / CBS 8224 / DSM 1558 / NBRC 9311 / NRRL Y-6157 / RJB 2259-6 / UBC 559-6) TaxID=578456 RepID=UPI0003F4A5AD|nr:uncharacterized protein TREMEDRAFT_58761 [Tremella mesenterica DSM 1558]EIW72590.1 hypothetical protein TREMEDRAFT_58761 [Tremella mesenterica DSM 1558]